MESIRATFQVRNHQDNLIEQLENIHYDSRKPIDEYNQKFLLLSNQLTETSEAEIVRLYRRKLPNQHSYNIETKFNDAVMPVEKTLENAMWIATVYDNCIFKNRKNDHQDHQINSNKVSNKTNKYCKECKTKTHNTVECVVN